MMNVTKKTRTRRSVRKLMMIMKKKEMTIMRRIKRKQFKLKEKGKKVIISMTKEKMTITKKQEDDDKQ
jgi:hypothetical protein